MKRLFAIAYMMLTSLFAFAQTELASTEVSGVEFKVIKCQEERSTNSVKVKLSVQNKEEFPLEKISISELTFTDSDGNQSMPLGKYYAAIFAWQQLNYSDIPTGPVVNSKDIILNQSHLICSNNL